MALEDQIISLNFGQGVDTKTDSKQVINGKMVLLKDAVFTNTKRITKRNGYTSMPKTIFNSAATITAPKTIASCKNETIIAAGNSADTTKSLYSFSQDQQAWVNKGYYESIAAERVQVSESPAPEAQQSWAVIGNIALYAYVTTDITSFVLTYLIVDLSTNTQISPTSFITSASSNFTQSPKVCVVGSKFGIFFNDVSANLKLVLISVSGASYSVGAPILIASSLDVYLVDEYTGFDVGAINTAIQYDVVTTSTGAALSYSKGTTVVTVTINTSGSITHTDTQTSAGAPSPVTLCTDSSNGNVWVYWVDTAAGPSVDVMYYKILSPTLGAVLSKTSIATISTVKQIAAVSTALNAQIVYYSYKAGTSLTWQNVGSFTLDNIGTATASLSILGTELHTKPFIQSGSIYLGVFYRSSAQGTVFYINMTDYGIRYASNVTTNPTVAAKFIYGQAVQLFRGYLAQPSLISSTKIGIFTPHLVTTLNLGGITTQIVNSDLITLDFSNKDSYQALKTSNSLILNGGVTSIYDGGQVSELGFNVYPEIISATAHTSGGSMADGLYLFQATFEYVDANGNTHRSSPGVQVPVTISGGSGSGSVTILVGQLNLSQRNQLINNLVLYRTAANGQNLTLTQSTYSFDGSTDVVLTLSDQLPDSSIASNPPLYTTGGVVDNISPPPSLIQTLYNDRVWIVDSTNPISAWYSKTIASGTGVSFSDLFAEEINFGNGGITGMSEMDEKIIFFKRSDIVLQAGDGPNDLGFNSTLSNPQIIPSDVGCTNSKSIILMPNGVFFKSSKGIYLLSRSIQVQYIGPEVEAYNSQDITSAVLLDSKNQVRFLTSSGLTLLYDYFFNQWSVFTNHTGNSSSICGGSYTYTRIDGNIYQENATSFLDGASSYAVSALTAWIKFSQVQGFQRVRELELLGDYANGSSASHGIQISCAYDFLSNFTVAVPRAFGTASSSGPLQYREFLPIQKCDAVQFLIEEITNGVTGESMQLSDLCLEVGIKRGMNKLGAANSVG